MLTDGELPGVPRVRLRRPEGRLADNHPLTQKLVRLNAAPQRALGGDLYRIGGERQRWDAKSLDMRLPAAGSANCLSGMFRQAGDDGRFTSRCGVVGAPHLQHLAYPRLKP